MILFPLPMCFGPPFGGPLLLWWRYVRRPPLLGAPGFDRPGFAAFRVFQCFIFFSCFNACATDVRAIYLRSICCLCLTVRRSLFLFGRCLFARPQVGLMPHAWRAALARCNRRASSIARRHAVPATRVLLANAGSVTSGDGRAAARRELALAARPGAGRCF